MTDKLNELNTTGIATKEEVDAWIATHEPSDKLPPQIEAYKLKILREYSDSLAKVAYEFKNLVV
jgi:hypothetical protein